ncbi:lipoprotein localization protein LolB [Vibrio astriarenae]|uniref:Outer-membrane lipoprotein LolB n=1 Tax=Vibrio astriarenae TaxID=1481923 RepID=A0A7Z2YCX7_9VIBR|nr:lipoprotein insertase outer membrane protein LolB [Vibrio astriarenae]QIA62761.1 lipoprotein localization protein LolB [Vibrio astriarenae]
MNLITIFRRLSFISLVLVLINGCSSLPESATSVEWQSHQQKLQSIVNYRANGKLGYISPQERQSLNFDWREDAQSNRLTLRTILGQTALSVTSTPDGAEVTTMEGDTYTGNNAQQLIAQLTGLSIPADSLPSWLIGLPADADHYELTAENTLASLDKQIGGQFWRLTYSRYSDVDYAGETLPLPSRMTLTNGDTKLNIIISKWAISQ